MRLQSTKLLRGNLQLPGDKSISHRAAMFSALAEGTTQIQNFASSADCAATLNCLGKLGVEITRNGASVVVKGVGKNGFSVPLNMLDCENSGTTVRLMSGILAGQDFTSVLTGDESLQKRPMRRVMEPLAQMGAKIESNENRLPLTIHGKSNLEPITYALPVASAQVKSCVLLAGLNASGKTKVLSPKSVARETKMRNHTELMLQWFGVDIEEDFVEIDDGFVHQTTISGDARLTANGVLNVPSDVSSAAFFLVAAACLPDSEIMLENVGLNPTRTAIIEVLRNFGARIETQNEREVCNELVGEIIVRGGLETSSKANILRGEIIAGLIDELPILSIFGTQIEGGLEIRDAQELRVKESDRIAAVVENLRRMNARVEEFPDGLRVEKSDLRGAKIDSFGDHRIAMAFSIAAIFATGETEIEGADCVKVSFPEFFNTLKTICE